MDEPARRIEKLKADNEALRELVATLQQKSGAALDEDGTLTVRGVVVKDSNGRVRARLGVFAYDAAWAQKVELEGLNAALEGGSALDFFDESGRSQIRVAAGESFRSPYRDCAALAQFRLGDTLWFQTTESSTPLRVSVPVSPEGALLPDGRHPDNLAVSPASVFVRHAPDAPLRVDACMYNSRPACCWQFPRAPWWQRLWCRLFHGVRSA